MLRLPQSDGRTPEWHLQSPGEYRRDPMSVPNLLMLLKQNLIDKMLKEIVSLSLFNFSLCIMMARSLDIYLYVQ